MTLLYSGKDWNWDKIHRVYDACEKIATEELKLDCYPNIIEIITSDQMIDNYSSHGLPNIYDHWSFGKSYTQNYNRYKQGQMGLAFEIVINTDPCINYLMEENTMTCQNLVIAHAAFGHNCFSDDTEILTRSGWKTRENIEEGEMIATINRETRLVEYHPVDKKFEYDYDGDMCWFKNSTADHLVTPNHKMVFIRNYTNEFCEKNAIDWTSKGTYAICSGFRDASYDIENKNYSDDELRLLVWGICDGCLEYEPTGYWRYGFRKERKILRFSALLEKLNISYKRVIDSEGSTRFMLNLDKRFFKKIPQDFMLSARQTQIFLEEWLVTDGSTQTDNKERMILSGSLFTNVDLHRDKIQELAAISGIKTSYRTDTNGVHNIDIRFNKQNIQLSSSPLTKISHYAGKVWCVSVKNHTLISRRNGRILVTGNSFFKNNYLFKQWTHADYIIDYLQFARGYIKKMEEKYGEEEVEKIIDCAHSLQNNGMDRYPKPRKRTLKEEIQLEKDRHYHYEKTYDDIWSLIPKKLSLTKKKDYFLPDGPEENLLYFLEKKSPILKPWQKEIIRIIRKVSQYFRPQMGTQVANEGWASTVHYYIMNRLGETGQIDESSMLEFLDLHTAVVRQVPFDHPGYSGFNPYYLGFNIFSEIRRISESPTNEDRYWFPDFAGKDWLENWHHAFTSFRDDSLIQQFMTPNLIRKMKLFSIETDDERDHYRVDSVSNESGYRDIRNTLADNYNVMKRIPDIQVTGVDFDSRECYLTHFTDDMKLLDSDSAQKVLENFRELWGFSVILQTRDRSTNDFLDEYESIR